jgi:hypothetical protein
VCDEIFVHLVKDEQKPLPESLDLDRRGALLRKRYDSITKNIVYDPIKGFGCESCSHFLPGIYGKFCSIIVVTEEESGHGWQYIPDPKDLSVLYLFKDIVEVLRELLVGIVVVDAAQGFVETEEGSGIVFRNKGL